MRVLFFSVLMFFLANLIFAQNQEDPKPYGVLPSGRQLEWHRIGFYGIIHFTPTTFEDKEWGYGDANSNIFNPTDFDAEQIVNAAKSAEMRGIVFVCKHHDGFCLWNTATTEYNISKSPWRNGAGDMVQEFKEACDKAGLKFGVYISPWDRNSKYYGSPEYLKIYREQLREVYSNYGNLFMSWHDGANGGDGYYGGANEMRNIDRLSYYDWHNTWQITRNMQPNANIFSDVGLDVRWIGNENGLAGDTCWATYTPHGQSDPNIAMPGDSKYRESVNGHRKGKYWMPGECDVPLRPGWFYHKKEDDKIKSLDELKNIYIKSVGRGQGLDIGLAPDTRGKLHQNDIDTLAALGKWIRNTFDNNIAKNAKIKATNVRNSKKYNVKNLTDDCIYSFWATKDGIFNATLTIKWNNEIDFDFITLRENIKLGQRIDNVKIEVFCNKKWIKIAKFASIGALRIVNLPNTFRTEKIRIHINNNYTEPCLSEIGVYKSE